MTTLEEDDEGFILHLLARADAIQETDSASAHLLRCAADSVAMRKQSIARLQAYLARVCGYDGELRAALETALAAIEIVRIYARDDGGSDLTHEQVAELINKAMETAHTALQTPPSGEAGEYQPPDASVPYSKYFDVPSKPLGDDSGSTKRHLELAVTALSMATRESGHLETDLANSQIKHMVERFLGWRLPENFHPDAGISFQPTFNEHTPHPMKHEPTGTNLFDFNQASAMVRYMIEGLPAPKDTP